MMGQSLTTTPQGRGSPSIFHVASIVPEPAESFQVEVPRPVAVRPALVDEGGGPQRVDVGVAGALRVERGREELGHVEFWVSLVKEPLLAAIGFVPRLFVAAIASANLRIAASAAESSTTFFTASVINATASSSFAEVPIIE